MRYLIIFLFLISVPSKTYSFFKNKKDIIEKCADEKTQPYWGLRALSFQGDIWRLEDELEVAKDKYEKDAIKNMIKSKRYYLNLYKNASKKDLDQKLYEFTDYGENYNECKKEYSTNPNKFKQQYE